MADLVDRQGPVSIIASLLCPYEIIDLAAVLTASLQHSVPGNAGPTSPNLSDICPRTSLRSLPLSNAGILL